MFNEPPKNLPFTSDLEPDTLPGDPVISATPKVNRPESAVLPKIEQAQDIFSDNEKRPKPVLSPLPEKPAMPAPPKPLTELPDDSLDEDSGGSKRYYLLGILVIVVILIGVGYYFYPSIANLFSSEQAQPQNEEGDNAEAGLPLNQAEPEPAPEIPPVTPQPVQIDTDKDGLVDEEEKQLGLDYTEPDTDGDGLYDREEVKVYKTNALNPDTDGDGYLDGNEVDNGYDPNGPGRLTEINNQ